MSSSELVCTATRPSLLDAVTAPRAVALIGASDDARKTSARPLRFLRRHGFAGAIYPVNPNRATVLGEDAYPSLDALPGPVDHAFVLVPTEHVFDAVEACGRAGVPVVTVLADGFAEAGEQGLARQARLLAIARAHGVRILGPNSVGVIDTASRMALTANAAFAAEALPAGRLALLSHSGNMLGTLLTRGAERGLGFSKMISVGNEADLCIGEIGAALADDEATGAFLLFLESVRRADALAEFASRAHAAGKPIIAYLIGRSQAGRDVALSHTGSIVGTDEAADAFFREHGIVRADTFEALFELPPLLIGRRPRPEPGGSVTVIATSGGGAGMVVDRLGTLGVDVHGPGKEAVSALAESGVHVLPGRIFDLTLAGTRRDAIIAALAAAAGTEGTRAVIAVIGSSAEFDPQLAVEPIIEFSRGDGGGAGPGAPPVAVFILPRGEASHRLLAQAGIASFRTPESCADAVRAFLDWRPPAARTMQSTGLRDADDMLREAAGDVLDEAEAARLFAALGIETAPNLVLDAGEELPAALPFDFPVAVKLLSPGLAHKTEAGGVVLGVADMAGLETARTSVLAADPDGGPEDNAARVLVQAMQVGLAEVLVGLRRDPQVGPIVTVGFGGTLAEIYRDFAVRLAPVDADAARAMIDEVAGLAPLSGYRNMARGDLDALAGAVAAVSRLALAGSRQVAEAEINPLIVREEGSGAVAVDGLVRLEPREEEA